VEQKEKPAAPCKVIICSCQEKKLNALLHAILQDAANNSKATIYTNGMVSAAKR
jgi:hypothetical protein